MIGEALTLTITHRKDGALHVIYFASVVTETELREITVQMLLFAMLVHAAHTALED
jgi:hypothetical protein